MVICMGAYGPVRTVDRLYFRSKSSSGSCKSELVSQLHVRSDILMAKTDIKFKMDVRPLTPCIPLIYGKHYTCRF